MTMELTPIQTTPAPPSSSSAAAAAKPRAPATLYFSNGGLKRHQPHYRECLRNHAATLGGHAVDGCGEFMPSPLSNPSDPSSLKCAACGCHRNFHRRDDDFDNVVDDDEDEDDAAEFTPPATKRRSSSSHSPPHFPSAPQMLMALSAGLSGADADNIPSTPNASLSAGRKRFRTKFSTEQKERMHAFSEKLGWKMQKKDDKDVEEFCNEIGVGKGVLKVWMHNNKHNFVKRDGLIMPLNTTTTTTTTSTNGDNNINANINNNNNGSNAHLINGSSSSS